MAITPRSLDGLPRSDLWATFLLFVLGPAGIVALALSIPWVKQSRVVALFVASVAYLIGVIVSMIVAVNFGIVAP